MQESRRLSLDQAATSVSLLAKVKARDETAWHQLVDLYGPLVMGWARRSGLNDNDAADVFQEAFRSVAGHLETYRPKRSVGAFRCWLRSIVRSKIADHFRKQNREPVGTGGTEAQRKLTDLADGLTDDEETEEAEETALVVQRALDLIRGEFEEKNWVAFRRVSIDGLSATEVAQQAGVTPQSVRQANYRIRKRLRDLLQGLVD